MIRQLNYLQTVDKQAEGENGKAGKGEPECITGQGANDANAAEQAEQTENNADPESDCFRGGIVSLSSP